MDVTVAHPAAPPVVTAVDDLQHLRVVHPAGAPLASLGELGRVEGEHAWLEVAALRRHGRPEDPAWVEGFDAMIAFAGSRGWLDEAGTHVRAHLETS